MASLMRTYFTSLCAAQEQTLIETRTHLSFFLSCEFSCWSPILSYYLKIFLEDWFSLPYLLLQQNVE